MYRGMFEQEWLKQSDHLLHPIVLVCYNVTVIKKQNCCIYIFHRLISLSSTYSGKA